MKTLLSFLIILVFLMPALALGKLGVGINIGKIEIDEPLKPGGIYNFPSLGVINTGDESSEYELDVTYHQDQEEQRPPREWFSFAPPSFRLEPGQNQQVQVKLNLSLKAKPGDYFAYLEARPVVEEKPGTTIGIAAATKAYFTVVPANLWQAITHRVSTYFEQSKPISYVVLVVIILAAGIVIFRRFFAFQIGIRKK